MKKKYNKAEYSDSEILETLGTPAPHSIELEQRVLGAILIDDRVLADVSELLKPEHFYSAKNKLIYRAMLEILNTGGGIDLNVVKEELKKIDERDIVPNEYLIDLTEITSTSANVMQHAQYLIEKWMLREEIHISSSITTEALDNAANPYEILDNAQTKFIKLSDTLNGNKDIRVVKDELKKVIEELRNVKPLYGVVTGIPTGLTELDEATGGFHKKQLVIIGARPGVGKSSLMMNIAQYAALQYNFKIGILSMEMSFEALMKRWIAMNAGVDGFKLQSGTLKTHEWKKINDTYGIMNTGNLIIDDTPRLTTAQIKSTARKMKKEHDIDMLIVDYLQLARASREWKDRKDLEVGEVILESKSLAKELDINVVELSQFNREIEKRGAKQSRPKLSDFKESSEIEQTADLALMLHRPGMNMEAADLEDATDKDSILSTAEIIIGKNRNGPTKIIKVKYTGETTSFSDFDRDPNINPRTKKPYPEPKEVVIEEPLGFEKDEAPF